MSSADFFLLLLTIQKFLSIHRVTGVLFVLFFNISCPGIDLRLNIGRESDEIKCNEKLLKE